MKSPFTSPSPFCKWSSLMLRGGASQTLFYSVVVYIFKSAITLFLFCNFKNMYIFPYKYILKLAVF